MKWTQVPTEVGWYYWRELYSKDWQIRKIEEDGMGLFCVGSKMLTLAALGGEWKKVPPP